MTNKKIWDSWESNIHEQEASKKRIISAKQSILTPYFYKKLIGIFMKRKIFLMLLVFSATSFLYACGNSNPMYQSSDEMKLAFDNAIYTCYDDNTIKAQLFFADDNVTNHIFFENVGDIENIYDIEDWNYTSNLITLNFQNEEINIKDSNTIEYDGYIYEVGDIAEEYLTGNPFLDAFDKDSVDSGGGLINTISLSKTEAINADQDKYKEFIEQRVNRMNSRYEMLIVHFDDGTGIIYYGCDPSNNMYGTLSSHAITKPYGYIVEERNGMYSYHEIKD